MVRARKRCTSTGASATWQMILRRERELIDQWREKRVHDPFRSYKEFFTFSFTLATIQSFVQNVNIMLFVHISISTIAVFIFQKFNVSFDVNVTIFVSPIVFPLAFSINSDFQRREKVLEDLAAFKSAGITWYFCMREWRHPAGLDANWISAVGKKVESLLFLLSEYLLTSNVGRRLVILRAIYEDFSDANELIESLRASKLPANSAIVSRSVQCVHLMCLSVERLRVVRDYRSPRCIRSFNKVVILTLLITLAPYFVHLGIKSGSTWQPYYFAVILAFIFSTLHGVQDNLDDPFDGIGQDDDINLDIMEEWAPILDSMNRTTDQVIREGQCDSYLEASVDVPLQHSASITNDDINNIPKKIEDAMSTVDPVDQEFNIYSNFSVYSSSEINVANDEMIQGNLLSEAYDLVSEFTSPIENYGYDNNDDILDGYVLL